MVKDDDFATMKATTRQTYTYHIEQRKEEETFVSNGHMGLSTRTKKKENCMVDTSRTYNTHKETKRKVNLLERRDSTTAEHIRRKEKERKKLSIQNRNSFFLLHLTQRIGLQLSSTMMCHGSKNPLNKPPWSHQSNDKQRRSWQKKNRKMEDNEEARRKYPPFRASSNIKVIHVHYQTTINTIDELIVRATTTKRFVVDTESDKRMKSNKGGLIQIQFVHSIDQSTIILIEVNYLPETQSMLFRQIKELCSIIFDNNNDIISWGPINFEFKEFHHLSLVHLGRMRSFNLQSLFGDGVEDPTTHPEMERRDRATGRTSLHVYDTPGEIEYRIDDDDSADSDIFGNDDGDQPTAKPQLQVSLQKAVGEKLGKFVDKTLTMNYWQCGLDLHLNTWREWLFSEYEYDERIEKQEREKMKEYAINDCASVAELFFHMYPNEMNDYPKPNPSRTSTNTGQGATPFIHADGLPETFFPRFNRTTNQSLETNRTKAASPPSPHYEPVELLVQPTLEEIEQVTSLEEQRRIKAERQRKKNEKYKWKKQNLHQFDHKIRRPLYFKYDYRKIRSQLADDNIHTSHQITINKELGEVMIGFKSDEELQRAKSIMRINYFSKDQFNERWG